MLVRNNSQKIIYFIKDHRLDYLFIFLLVFLLMAWLQAGPYFLNTESFYHAKLIESAENWLSLDNFSWFQPTNYATEFVDSNWLYHILLSVLVGVLPTFLVIKIVGALLSSLLALYIYYWLVKHKAFLPVVFVLLLFSSQYFILSINKLGAQSLTLLVLLLGLEFVVNYKYWQLCLISIMASLLTGQFLFLFVMALMWLLVEIFYNKYRQDIFREKLSGAGDWFMKKIGLHSGVGKRKWLMLISCCFGLLIGLMVHPYWPESLSFYNQQALSGMGQVTFSGFYSEMVSLIMSAKVIFLTLLISIISLIFLRRTITKITTFLLALAFVFIIISALGGRGIEFTYLIIILASSILLRDCYGNIDILSLWNSHKKNRHIARFIIIATMIIIAFLPLYSHYYISKSNKYPLDYMQGAGNWLYYHTPDNSLVINSDNEDWAPLFYYNDNNKYWWGLESPANVYESNQKDFTAIVNGYSNKSLYAFFKGKIKADYMLVNKGRGALNKQLQDNIYFTEVYSDKYCNIYQIQ